MDTESSKVCALCQIEKPPEGYYQTAKGRCCKECVKLKVRLSRKRAYEVEDDSSAPGEQMGTSESPDASLYILCNPLLPGMVKIGRAACPVARAQKLSESHPFHLTVFQSYYQMGCLESKVHHKLAHRRVTSGPGREWYHASPDEADLIVRATLLEHRWSSP